MCSDRNNSPRKPASGTSQIPLTTEEQEEHHLAPFAAATLPAAAAAPPPQAQHFPPQQQHYPSQPVHHQVPVPGPASAPTRTDLLPNLPGATADEIAQLTAQATRVEHLEQLEQEVVRRRMLLEAALATRHGGGGGGGGGGGEAMVGPSSSSSPYAYSLPTPNSYPSPSQPSASSLYPSLLHTSLGNAAAPPTTNGLYTVGRNEQVPNLHSTPLPQYRSRSLSAPTPHQHQQQQHPHFSPISAAGRSMSHSSLAHFAMAPALAGAGIGAGTGARAAGSGLHANSGYLSSLGGPSSSAAAAILHDLPSTSTISTSGIPHHTIRHVIPLGLGQEDRDHLTEYLCFIRNDCIEIFPATDHDVRSDSNARGVVQGQVGMRCRFCAHRRRVERANRSTSYPSSVSRMYQSLTMMLREHFPCPDMPHHTRSRFHVLKEGNAGFRTKESKGYWIASAHKLGLIDTEDGIRMGPPQPPLPSQSLAPQTPQK